MKITHLIAAACYWTGVDALFYRLNRKAKRIVTFHNVLPDRLYRGNPVEVGEEAVRMAEELGYPCAVSDCNSSAWNAASRLFLPRMALGADKYDFHFELSGAKFFLKFRRLLPRVQGVGRIMAV